MSKNKDLGSYAASSDPDTADRDRVELRRHAERNIERSGGKQPPDDRHPAREAEKDGRETIAGRTEEPRPLAKAGVDRIPALSWNPRQNNRSSVATRYATSCSSGRPCGLAVAIREHQSCNIDFYPSREPISERNLSSCKSSACTRMFGQNQARRG